jgi:hypothetical protein
MRRRYGSIVLAFVAALALHGIACANEPIKWSAPLSAYPNAWAQTTPPPAYVNQYANQYPNWGPYGGHQPYTQTAPPWQRAYAPGFSGNPYMRSYAP